MRLLSKFTIAWLIISNAAVATTLYVSSTGTGDGRSQGAPMAWGADVQGTIERVRANGGDVASVLIERGSVYTGGLGMWRTSNVRIGCYGDENKPRPVFRCDKFLHTYAQVDGITIENLDIQHVGAEANGLQLLGHGSGLTIRNCRIQGFAVNVNIQGTTGRWRDVAIEDCVILDATSTSGRAQGVYAEAADGIRITGSIFDRNGTAPSIQSHAVYVHALCSGAEVAGCVFSRSAATGFQARPGGIVADNVFIACPISLTYGYVLGGSDPTPGGVTGSVERNVIVHGRDISPTLIRGIGMQVGNCQPGTVVADNLIAHSQSAQPWEAAMQLYYQHGAGMSGVQVTGNYVVDWNGILVATTITPDKLTFTGNTIHRVRYPLNQGLLQTKPYVAPEWIKARVSDNTFIESATGRTYPGTGAFDDFDGLRAGEYTAAWLASYFRSAWGFEVDEPNPEPEPIETEMTVTVPPGISRLIVEIEQ